jgi:esterase/lipase superfamily enzyme
VESPSILRLEIREDARKHVVLQSVATREADQFFREVAETVARSPRHDAFVFVHGYNVTFENAARRTAQMAYDLKFEGAPIFYSWPSQGGLLKYTVDETNVAWTAPHLKQFLLDLARQSNADAINLIAHSMGNRALTDALRQLAWELGDNAALFSQIVLAAPDIDAEVFRRDIAPAIAKTGRRVTLYASSNDQALLASKQVHGYPRAGDSGEGLVVTPGLDTIDVSTVDTSLVGHSYYGGSDSILTDIHEVIQQALPASQRRWLRPALREGLTYWIFQSGNLASQPSDTPQRQ